MIAASEPLEFIPRGRQAVDEHPGPPAPKQTSANASATEHLLMHRMQNVNISSDDNSALMHIENWTIAELYEGAALMSEYVVNSEQELYFKGHTAVWTRGIAGEGGVLPRTCFTCDTPIRHAFFCPDAFIRTDEMDRKMKWTKAPSRADQKPTTGICLIDSTALRVYLSTGEDFLTSLEFPVSQTWQTPFGILLQKNASSATISTQSIPMPRLFSLAHPLDEMCPVLVRPMVGGVAYLTDSDYTLIFATASSPLVLLFDQKTGKHFISRLRKVTEEETNTMCANDTMNAETTAHSELLQSTSLLKSLGGRPNQSHPTLFGVAGKHSFSSINRTHSPFAQKAANITPMTSAQLLQNVSSATSVGGGVGGMGSFANRSGFVNSPRDRLQSTLGTSTLGGGFGATSRMGDLRKEGLAMPAKPIAPEWCLEQIWTEPMPSKEYMEMGSTGFFHTDLVGQRYMCYMLPASAKLKLVRLDGHEKVHKSGIVASIPARDAIALTQMNMLVVLDTCGTLILYSGATMMGKVHVGGVLSSFANLSTSFGASFPRRSSLLPSINSDAKFDDELHSLSPVHPLQPQLHTRNSGFCCGVRDPSGNRLTLIYPGGRMYRISIPLMSECPFVTKCLGALQAVLRRDLSLQFMVKWYGIRNAPGSHDLSASAEWSMFRTVLLEQIGRPIIPIGSCFSNSSTASSTSDEPKKRRKSENCLGTNEDWEFLTRHMSGVADGMDAGTNVGGSANAVPVTSPRNNCSAPLFPYIPLVFKALHLFYEDQKLNVMMQMHMASLAEFLYQLAVDLQMECFSLHYFLDFPSLVYVQSGSFITEAETKKLLNPEQLDGEVPSVFKYVNDLIVNRAVTSAYPYVPSLNERSRQVILLTYLLSTGKHIKYSKDDECISTLPNKESMPVTETPRHKDDPKMPLSKRVVAAFLQMKITRSDLTHFPIALQYMFSEALEHSRLHPPIETINADNADVCKLLLRPELLAHTNFEKDEASKMEPNRTFRNVQKEHSLSPRIPATPDVIPKSDVVIGDDGMEHIDTKLMHLRFPDDLRINEVRRLLGSTKPVPVDIVQLLGVSDHDFIEEQEKQLLSICNRTMAQPMGRGMFTLRTVTPVSTESMTIPKLCLSGKESLKGATVELQQIEVPPNMSQWPLFHNGVAAGLQVTPEARDIDSTWIVYNKPKVAQEGASEHGGFLMALGLNGHLKTLSFMSIYDYLVKSEEMTSVGLLLGIAAAHRGSMDVTTTKMLSVHIEALLPATALELDIPQNIQVAAIMGIGLIYQGTAKRHMAEVLLQEIGRPPGPEMENCIERESYALTAGLALGLVTLGQGESSTGLRDLQLPDTLHYYMIGGNKRALSGSQREKYKLPSFQIREGDTVNIDVTAPGATLALGLMFFGTSNQAVANWMRPPETSYLLDLVRPDLLMLRVIARNLIMWDDIKPTDEWLSSQFPKVLDFDLKNGPPDDSDDIDHEANCQAYCNILAGAALCLGLRYAGTEDITVYYKLSHITYMFLNDTTHYIIKYAGKATVELCLVLSLVALTLVFAGTGHLEILRLCRMLRARIGNTLHIHVTYGSQMAVHMALGFLFLGAGRFTLRRTPEAIAALVCALFPKFPTNSNDNRYHLQAFRHLYVLAVEPRVFLPRDIDSGKLCLCEIVYGKITENGREMVQPVMGPCILPELETLYKVEVVDSNYWPVCFERGKNWDQLEKILAKSGCIDIKQKAGCLSSLDDPFRLKSLLAQTLTTEQFGCWMIEPKTLLSFSNDQHIVNFTRIFMARRLLVNNLNYLQHDGRPKAGHEELEAEQMIIIEIYNCLTKDRMHALPIYMNLLLALQQIEKRSSGTDLWQIKIISSLLQLPTDKPDMLLSSEILRSHIDRVTGRLAKWSLDYSALLQRFLFSSNCTFLQDADAATLGRVAALITFYELPMNVMNCIDVGTAGGQPNYLRLLVECRRMRLKAATVHCISECLRKATA